MEWLGLRQLARSAAAVFVCALVASGFGASAASAQDIGQALMEAFEEDEAADGGEPMTEAEYQNVISAVDTDGDVSLDVEPATDDQRALWSDFNHYVRIARPELANASATKLMEQVSNQQLLNIVEASDYTDYQQTLARAQKMQTLEDVASELSERIQQARVERSRSKARIRQDIRKLASGTRANANATERLAAAGQYAAPFLLQTLTDPEQRELHPYVMAAMVAIGRPMVYPLSEAIGSLEPVPQGQVAQVLAEIGYPRALAYLKAVIEDEQTDSTARNKIESAYQTLAESLRLPTDVSASELFLTLGENLYDAQTRGRVIAGFDPAIERGLVWQYLEDAGLVAVTVPRTVYGDVLARKAATRSLSLDARRSRSLSLWLASNLRRENNYPQGEDDPSYPADLRPPSFYARMAGPLRQHDVLEQALQDGDTDLALDAIDALSRTAGVDALVNRPGAVQPLLNALSFPDRRVRFNAAFTLVRARPSTDFPGSDRVVPVLSEAVRQSDERFALVLTQSLERNNEVKAMLRQLGYSPFGGSSLEQVSDQINAGPGVDVIVTDYDVRGIESLLRQTAMHYKLAATPIVAMVSSGEQIELSQRYEGEVRLRPTAEATEASDLEPALENARAYAGTSLSSQEATAFALKSLQLLESVAIGHEAVFNVHDAAPALRSAMTDPRPDVVRHAARVLALLDSTEAQRAIADVALDPTTSPQLKVDLLDSLAVSARRFGNRLTSLHLSSTLELVRTAYGDVGAAAAELHGALTLPTSNVVEMIAE